MTAHHDPWADRLSEYLDGDLSARERRACEDHLACCTACSAALGDLRAVVARAGGMRRSIEPGRDLWPGIARRLTRTSKVASWRPVLPGRLRPQLAAAALVLVACVAVVVWLVQVRPHREAELARPTAAEPARPAPSNDADHTYEVTVAKLDRQARARLTLDRHVIEVLDENLATLDAAIASYRDALAEDPGDQALRRRLQAVRQKKLDVLQQAVSLAGEGTE